jgi:flagellar operon protein
MSDRLRIDDLLIHRQGPRPDLRTSRASQTPPSGSSFADALRTARDNPLKFSAHAQTRIQSRHIALGPLEMHRIEGAVDRAASKGSRESLVMLDQTALVISVANRTVITVVDKDNLKQNVFTNIDSAVIA